MKEKICYLFFVSLLLSVLTSCGSSNAQTETENKETEQVVLTIRNPKVEIATQFEQMVQEYERQNPNVKIHVETVGGASDDFSDIIAQIAAGQGTDIFTNIGYDATKEWINYLEDLSSQPWVEKAYPDTLKPITLEDKVYGMPMDIEGFGIVYNRELFQKAGIQSIPRTYSELKVAAEKLKNIGVTPFANGYYEEWKLGYHLTSLAFAIQQDPIKFNHQLKKGKESFTTNVIAKDLLSFLDLTLQYGNQSATKTDYYTEVEMLANEEAAMILQGSWVQPLLDEEALDKSFGIFPVPLNDKANSKILTGVPNYWVVNKKASSIKKREAKKFLNWMVSSSEGQQFMTERFGFAPAFKHIKTNDIGPISKEVLNVYHTKETYNSNWFAYSSSAKREAGRTLKRYLNRELSKDETLRQLDEVLREDSKP
ncbi:extracellular solute-binding protein [Priestia flexa]|nr:extracellular solute-binding protein [Priestia flexa]